jgi:L-alanine-DL-glutamate epimerase-like enolase superfamily enzyme
MKIVGATVLEYARRLDGRSWNPASRWIERRAPLLLLHADTGASGIGEAWSRQDAIGDVLDTLSRRIGPAIIGRRIDRCDDIRQLRDDIRRHVDGDAGRDLGWPLAAAVSALDIALWDLVAKAQQQPLWQALGGRSNRVSVYASGGLYRDGAGRDDLIAETEAHLAAGFRSIKIKVGGVPVEDDIERVRAVRDLLREDGALWVDAVNQLPARDALAAAIALRHAGATAIQAPVPFSDLTTMAQINADALPVIAGEAEHRLDAFTAMLDAGAVSIVQCNLGLCGGFSGAQAISEIAVSRGIDVTPQCHATAVLQAASLHCGAALPRVHSVEYHRFHDHLQHAMPRAMRRVVDDSVELSDEPGLGLERLSIGVQADAGLVRCHAELGSTRAMRMEATSR